MAEERRAKAIAVNLVHCYDTMNTYGADPDTLESRQIVFEKILSDYSDQQINSAFDRYFEVGKGLPEPSDILKILKERAVYNGPEYKTTPPDRSDYKPHKVVPWYGKSFDNLTDQDKAALKDHLVDLVVKKGPEHALEYCKFLKSYCGYPDLKTYIVEA